MTPPRSFRPAGWRRGWLPWLCLSSCWVAPACVSRPTTAPASQAQPSLLHARPAEVRPDDGRLVVEGDVTTADVGGILVIVKRVPGAENATSMLFIRGGAHAESPDEAGSESVSLSLVTMALRQDARLRGNAGAEFSHEVSEDFSLISGRGPTADWLRTLDQILEDFVSPPASEAYVTAARDLQLLRMKFTSTDGGEYAARALRTAFYRGQPNARPLEGDAATVARLNTPAVAAHLAQLRQRSRLVVVVVGDVDAATVVTASARRLRALPAGSFAAPVVAPPNFTAPTVSLTPSFGALGVVVSLFAAPNWQAPTFPVALVATEFLYEGLFDRLRQRDGVSWDVRARIDTTGRWPMGLLTAASDNLPVAFAFMKTEVQHLQSTPLSDAELRGLQEGAVARFHLERASTEALARMLGAVQIRTGDWRWSRVDSRVREVTAVQLQAYARKRLASLQTVILADPQKIDLAKFRPE
jgi:predicted Zn-dependent peptidase